MRKSKRSPNLNDRLIADIVGIIDGWVGRLTWELLIQKIAERTGAMYERQTLSGRVRILSAFQDCQKAQRNGVKDNPSKPADELSPVEVTMMTERLSRITAENSRLKMENAGLLEQFAIWAYNANSRNLSLEILSRPLPPIDRDVSKVQTKRVGRKYSN